MCRLLAVFLFLPLAAVAQEKKGTQYAFLVGCSGYSETQLKPLPYTVNDIDQFRQALLETGFEADHIKTMHDKQGIRFLPEKKKILKEFGTLLNGLKPEDTVIVALSGHGVHFKDDPTGFFCPLDADLKDKATLIPFEGKDGLFDQLKACKAKRKLLIVNACRNDPTSNRALAAEKIDLDDAAPEIVPEGVAAIYSCRAGQKSYYDPKKQAGIFFDHVTRAWRGEYAKGEQHSTIEDFFREVSTRTKADADTAFGEAQVPEVKREYKEEWRVPVSRLAAEFRAFEAALLSSPGSAPWILKTGPGRWREWKRLAEAGNSLAMPLYGRCVELAVAGPKDEKTALDWYRRAADAGLPAGMFLCGYCHEFGRGLPVDCRPAAEWYRKAAEAGHAMGMSKLGYFTEVGLGTAKDEKLAAEWYRKAADLGSPAAMNNVGYLTQTGRGVPKDEKAALDWYRKAAAGGDARGMTNLGYCLLNGVGTAQDVTAAADWYRKAADLGNTFAMTYMGILHETGTGAAKDAKAAADWYRKAAAGGDAAGMTRYGAVLQSGFGVTKDDKEAVTWYRKAADLGNAAGMFQLGYCLEKGLGTDKDEPAAVAQYTKAAGLGYADAMANLGYCYFRAVGVAKDEAAAAAWYKRGAEGGSAVGMQSYGNLLEFGAGVPKDMTAAVEWYRKAANLGNAIAQQRLTQLGLK